MAMAIFSVVGMRACELGDFEVEMAMVVDAEHFALQDVLQVFEIDDEAGDGIDLAGDGDLEGVVVAVSVAVGAFAEDALRSLPQSRRRSSNSGRRRIRLCG